MSKHKRRKPSVHVECKAGTGGQAENKGHTDDGFKVVTANPAAGGVNKNDEALQPKKDDGCSSEGMVNWPKWSFWATAAYVVLTGLLWLNASNQLEELHDGNTAAATNFRQNLRPWLGLDIESTPSPIMLGAPGEKVGWRVWTKNFGNSPAEHMQWHWYMHPLNAPIDWRAVEQETNSLDVSDLGFSFTVFNGQRVPSEKLLEVLGDAERAEIDARRRFLLLQGRITYDDNVGGTGHETTVCLVYVPAGNGRPEGYIMCPIKTVLR